VPGTAGVVHDDGGVFTVPHEDFGFLETLEAFALAGENVLAVTDMDGDEIEFRLFQGILSQWVNGQVDVAMIRSIAIDLDSLTVEDSAGTSTFSVQSHNTPVQVQIRALFAMAELAGVRCHLRGELTDEVSPLE
jgi:hypothetical protein